VTPIRVDWAADGATARLGDEIELSIGKMSSIATKGRGLPCYTALNGRLLRTPIAVQDVVRWAGGSSVKLTLLGQGPTSDAVRKLGLADIRPLAVFRTDSFEAVLPAGKDIGPIEG
jgi:hypothetical protein